MKLKTMERKLNMHNNVNSLQYVAFMDKKLRRVFKDLSRDTIISLFLNENKRPFHDKQLSIFWNFPIRKILQEMQLLVLLAFRVIFVVLA